MDTLKHVDQETGRNFCGSIKETWWPSRVKWLKAARLKKRLRKSPSTAKATDFEPMDKGEGSSEFAARADSTRYCKFVLWRFFLFDN